MDNWTVVKTETNGNVIEARGTSDGSQMWVFRKYGANKGRWGYALYKNGPRYYAIFRMKPTSSMRECQSNSGALRTFSTWEKAAAAVQTDVNDLNGWSRK